MNGKEFGIWAEEAAGRYLEREGMRVLARNYRVKCGELDLVAEDGEMVVFVEVNAIHGVDGEPELKVNAEKRRKLIATAKSFIGQYELYERPARFDVVTVQVDQKGKPVIRHEQDVFQAE
jgi:putative endonuclease